jgi:hypothetical protein
VYCTPSLLLYIYYLCISDTAPTNQQATRAGKSTCPSPLPFSLSLRWLHLLFLTWRKSAKDWTLEGLLYGFFNPPPPPHTPSKRYYHGTRYQSSPNRNCVPSANVENFRICDLRIQYFCCDMQIVDTNFFADLKLPQIRYNLNAPIQTCTTKISPKKPLENISWFCHEMAELLKSGVSSSLSYYEKFADSRMSTRICEFADCMATFARCEKKTILFLLFCCHRRLASPIPVLSK